MLVLKAMGIGIVNQHSEDYFMKTTTPLFGFAATMFPLTDYFDLLFIMSAIFVSKLFTMACVNGIMHFYLPPPVHTFMRTWNVPSCLYSPSTDHHCPFWWHSFSHPVWGRRLSWPGWLVKNTHSNLAQYRACSMWSNFVDATIDVTAATNLANLASCYHD